MANEDVTNVGMRAVAFENEGDRMLRVDVDGSVWLKPGAAVAWRGDLVFERRPTLGAESMEDAILREAAPLVRVTGRGRLYCGDHAAHVRIVRLEAEPLMVAWKDVLACEATLAFEPFLVEHGVGIAAGGFVAVKFSGQGTLAMLAHGKPVTLAVTPGSPLTTDPHATVAWSPDLTPTLKLDLTWRSALGHGGHQPVQMCFEGTGVVVVQPYQRSGWVAADPHPVKKAASLLA
jgi:uncharacterized protein (AIM24 family)